MGDAVALRVHRAGSNESAQAASGGSSSPPRLTVIVIAVVMVEYSSSTPTDKYIPNTDAHGVCDRPPATTGLAVPSTSEDVTGVQAATWFTTDHKPVGGGGG